MYETEMFLAGVSLEGILGDLKEISTKQALKESKTLEKGSTISFLKKPEEAEEVFRDDEHGYYVAKMRIPDLPNSSYEAAFTLKGEFIGTPHEAKVLCVDNGIQPQTIDADSNVCSIGFNEEEQAWYGWSHRAFSPPFKVGYIVDSDDHICCGCFSPTGIKKGYQCKTLDDCKKLAIIYAREVS